MSFLLLIDTSGIQNYIYRSSELKYIAQASQEIDNLSTRFAEIAKEQSVQLIVSAGGNASFCSDSEKLLKNICRTISRELIEKYNGLEVVAAIYPYEKGQLVRIYRNAGALLEQKKLTQARSATFTFPGLESSREKVSSPVKPYLETKYLIPNQTDNQIIMKCEGEKSDLMAFVTMDGLTMGQKYFKWLSLAEDQSYSDEKFIEEFQKWSMYLTHRWNDAWKNIIEDIFNSFPAENPMLKHPISSKRQLKLNWDEDQKSKFCTQPYLPIRKIFQGGDDLTFICDARIALSIIRNLIHYLEEKAENTAGIPLMFQNITVSAGAVFLDSHFPFVRAVRLADDVRKKAKKDAMESISGENEAPPSRFDWWVNRNGALRRPEKYDFTSSVRPASPASWDRFENNDLTGAWGAFAESRGKLKALAEAAQDGPSAVQEFLMLRGVPEATKPDAKNKSLDFLSPGLQKNGFNGARTPIIDISELFDIHFTLPRKEKSA